MTRTNIGSALADYAQKLQSVVRGTGFTVHLEDERLATVSLSEGALLVGTRRHLPTPRHRNYRLRGGNLVEVGTCNSADLHFQLEEPSELHAAQLLAIMVELVETTK